jgi:hypothetical protein
MRRPDIGICCLALALLWSATAAQAGAAQHDSAARSGGTAPTTDAAKADAPPSPSKLKLVRRFLQLNGTQQEIDSGSFLDRHGLPGGALVPKLPAAMTLDTGIDLLLKPMEAIRRAYQPRRAEFQKEYEHHVNWEFTEAELTEIVGFLETAAGQHFLAGRWRMDAYVGTTMEDAVEEILQAASRDLGTRR